MNKPLITDKPKPSWITDDEWGIMSRRDDRIRSIDKMLAECNQIEKAIGIGLLSGVIVSVVVIATIHFLP